MARKQKKQHILQDGRTQLLLAFLLFVGSAVLVHDREMHSLELAIIEFAFTTNSEIFTPIFQVVTRFGDIYAVVVLAGLLLFKKYYHVAVRLLTAGSLAYLLSGVGKDLVGRDRPEAFISDLVHREFYVRGSGFPSGHTALATAVGMTLAVYLPKKFQWIPLLLIIGVGYSRIQLGVHGPMDVVGGFAVGWFAFALTRFVQIKINPKGDKIT